MDTGQTIGGGRMETLLVHLANHRRFLVSSSYVWALCKVFEACPIMGLNFDSELALWLALVNRMW